MKKHLIAAAVAAAVAVPAMAQNVTISGYLEEGYTRLVTDGAATSTTLGGGIFGSTRIAFSGSEDLGGGLKAGFRLEADLTVPSGKLGKAEAGTSAAQQDNIFSRGAEVNLSGAFGMVRFGKFDHQGGENTDLNVVGNIALATGVSSSKNNGTAFGVEMGSDRDGTFAYRTPSLMGGYIEVAHTPGDTITASNSSDPAQGALTSVYYEGVVSGANVRLGYATQKAQGAVSSSNDDATRYGMGVSYNFGPVSASAHYASQTLIDQTKNAETTISVNMPLGNGLDLRGVYQDFDRKGGSAGSTTAGAGDFKETTIALAKSLSKRTNLYAAYTIVDNAGTAADTTRTYVGVSHSF